MAAVMDQIEGTVARINARLEAVHLELARIAALVEPSPVMRLLLTVMRDVRRFYSMRLR